jgi:pimeloyl-ACP methyl ester carboxylesterase
MFPAGLPGYSTHFVRVAPSLTLRVVEAHGTHSGPAVLFIHGWGCSAFVWRRNLPVLAAEGVRALAIDLPGHGLSDKPLDAEYYTPDAMADAVLATLDALGLDRAALVAHSLGAVVARRAVARAPDRISALVLLAPVSIGRVPILPLVRAISPSWIQALIPHLTFRWTIATGLWLSRAGKTTLSPREVDEYWAPTQFPEMTLAAVRMLHTFDCRSDANTRHPRRRRSPGARRAGFHLPRRPECGPQCPGTGPRRGEPSGAIFFNRLGLRYFDKN